jgi:hypothetical protein
MLLFRSEEDVDRWCQATGRPRGETLDAGRLHDLAVRWYGDRLDPEWRPRTVAESQAILDSVGLDGPFWTLA